MNTKITEAYRQYRQQEAQALLLKELERQRKQKYQECLRFWRESEKNNKVPQ